MTSGAKRGKRVSEAELRRLWLDSSLTVAEIGQRLGISQQAATGRALRRGLPRRPMGPAPAIRNDDEFRAMWTAGVRIEGMAEHFGVHEKSIRNHVARLGLARRGCYGWASITLAEWRARQVKARMDAIAAAERAAVAEHWRRAAA